ncbi:MAG: CRISPR-associated helicase Cas3' [Rubrobacter sp.]|nr:CRISPR-associated helicase Cas3' [Rubrobacter sp.]
MDDGQGKFYAHTPTEESEEWHDLVSHLSRTAELTQKNASKFGAGELGRLAGLWHDVGKFNKDFQKYLRECHEAEISGTKAPRGGSVPHAVYGAVLARESVHALAAVIHGHHAGLPNRAKYLDALGKRETRERYEDILPVAERAVDGLAFDGDARALFTDAPRDEFEMEVFQRMLFSALVDADFLDTETHFDSEVAGRRGSDVSVNRMWEVFERNQTRLMDKAFSDGTAVNIVRREVYGHCVEAAVGERGVLRLAVPTGGGKTRSGLAFALRHAVEHGLERVIVAAPYTSIIEQTAGVYRDIFSSLGEGAVLEHHSAIRREADEEAEPKEAERLEESRARARLATQNWDAPLAVTTAVQLFESLFANRTSRCRKLHNIVNSVVVLDEVQTLPVGLLAPTVAMLRELARRYGVSVVLCTATQPALDERSRYLEGFESVRDIVPPERASEHFRSLRRVEYETPGEPWSWEEAVENVLDASPERRAMVVVNTRRDALAILDLLEGSDREAVLHLSTLLCGAHRRDVLNEVRRRLDAGEPCLLVATQVVEAGVDLDFPVVFRAMGPLDRIVQAAGRCNREGKMENPGRVVVFRPEDGGMPPGEYESGTMEAAIMLENGANLHDPEVFREYFVRLYQDVDTDGKGIQKLRKEFDFPEVARRYRLISEQSVPVIVRYGEAWEEGGEMHRLAGRIRHAGLRGGDHRKIQPYAVSMFEREFEKKKEWTEEISEGVFMWNGGYDDLRGIEDLGDDPSNLCF